MTNLWWAQLGKIWANPNCQCMWGEGGHNNNGEPSSVYMGSLVYDKDIPLILLIICFPTLGP